MEKNEIGVYCKFERRKKMKKYILSVLILVIGICLSLGAGSANAYNGWYFQMQGVDGTLIEGEYYQVEVYFIPEGIGDPGTGNDGDNNLHSWCLDVDFDEAKLECLGVTYYDYSYTTPPFSQYWDGGIVPTNWDNDIGYIRDINGAEPPGVWEAYYPDEANNHLATIWFQAKVTGTFEDMMRWVDPDINCLADVDGVTYNIDSLVMWKEGDDMNASYDWCYVLHLGIYGYYGRDNFPQELAEQAYYSGVAAAKQTLRWIYGDDGGQPPEYNLYNVAQADLYSTYHTGSSGQDMSTGDIRTLIQTEKPTTTPSYAYNFSAKADDDEDMAIKRFIHWCDFNVQAYYPSGTGINEPQVSSLIVTSEDTYGCQWKTLRGFATDVDPCDDDNVFNIPDMTVHGLWLNDPAIGGLGYNVYVTGDEFRDMYEQVDGKYRSVVEPPEGIDVVKVEANLRKARISYVKGKRNQMLANVLKDLRVQKASSSFSTSTLEAEAELCLRLYKGVRWDGVIPRELFNSPDFKNIYSKSRYRNTLHVADLDGGEDYGLVVFSRSRKINTASMVLIVEKEEGNFRQATWDSEDQDYLPVSRKEAVEIAMKALGVDPIKIYSRSDRMCITGSIASPHFSPCMRCP
jgi:hypothetical protein